MEFLPIERPTTPGWYWYRTPTSIKGDSGFWMYHVAMIEDYDDDDRIVETLKVDEGSDGCDISTYPGQWFGPAIPEPTKQNPPFANQAFH